MPRLAGRGGLISGVEITVKANLEPRPSALGEIETTAESSGPGFAILFQDPGSRFNACRCAEKLLLESGMLGVGVDGGKIANSDCRANILFVRAIEPS